MPPFCPLCSVSFYTVVAAVNHYCIEGEVIEDVPQIEPPHAQMALER